jgi:hypothetical protein
LMAASRTSSEGTRGEILHCPPSRLLASIIKRFIGSSPHGARVWGVGWLGAVALLACSMWYQ